MISELILTLVLTLSHDEEGKKGQCGQCGNAKCFLSCDPACIEVYIIGPIGQTREKHFRFDYKFSENADGWLKLHQVPGTWPEARLRCHAEGGVLASPLTNQLRLAILDFVVQVKGMERYTIYTGIHASFSKGDYTSVEGIPLLKMPITWSAGEPDNYKNSESCLVMLAHSNGTFADIKCSETFPYVCYKKNTRLGKLNACGTYDTGYQQYDGSESCYKFHQRGLPWSRAYMTCAAEGAYLAIINSEKESQVLRQLYAKNPDNVISSTDPGIAAIGFHDWGERGSWMTIHGKTLEQAGFARFEIGQPDNATREKTGDKGEFCGSIFRSGYLNDVWCNVPVPFICEKDPTSLYEEPEVF